MPIEIQGANAGKIVMDVEAGGLEALNQAWAQGQEFIFNKDFQQVPWPHVPVAPPLPPRGAEPVAPNKAVFIDDMVVSVPAWAQFVTQNTRGTIEAWEQRPVNIGKNYANTGGLHKTILKVAEYEQLLKAV